MIILQKSGLPTSSTYNLPGILFFLSKKDHLSDLHQDPGYHHITTKTIETEYYIRLQYVRRTLLQDFIHPTIHSSKTKVSFYLSIYLFIFSCIYLFFILISIAIHLFATKSRKTSVRISVSVAQPILI